MFGTNFRNAYEFDPETYGVSGPDDLAVLLRQVMLQQGPQQQGIDSPSAPNAASGQDLESYGNPKGLPGRILALQADQPEVFGSGAVQQQFPSRDANFGQLPSAIAATRTPGTIHLSSRFEGQPNSTFPISGQGALPGASPMTAQGAGAPETRGAPQAPIRVAGASMNMTHFAWGGRGIPVPPTGPGTVPDIPMPHIPDWMKANWAAWKLGLTLFPQVLKRLTEEGGGYDAACDEDWREAREDCSKAEASGWKINKDRYGPFKRRGQPWTVEDCARGLVPARCGGNRLDEDAQPKKKK